MPKISFFAVTILFLIVTALKAQDQFIALPLAKTKAPRFNHPVVFKDENSGKMETAFLRYTLKRTGHGHGMKLKISADHDLGIMGMRLGPFEKKPAASTVRVNNHPPSYATILHSGDSWWVKFSAAIGQN